jgi:membrane-bound metal-dependent hydrolase YbcI (DUF457 family)
MDFISHFFLGFLLSALTINAFGREFFIFAAFMAMFPDFDVFLFPLLKKKRNYYLSHRAGSHSYITGVIISAITSLIFCIITGKPLILAYIISCLFYSLHVTLDLFTTSKIPIFYPLSKKEYRLSIDRAVNPLLMFISASIIIFYLVLLFFWPRLYYNHLLWIFFSFLYLIYFFYKIITKFWVQRRLPVNCQYIPGIFPFVYTIYENRSNETSKSFKLTKKFQFRSKRVKVIEIEIKDGSKELIYYEKAKQIFKGYRFFNKWEAIIPIISENELNIIVVLFLAESLANRTAYSLKIAFNKKTNNIDYMYDEFNTVLNKKY